MVILRRIEGLRQRRQRREEIVAQRDKEIAETVQRREVRGKGKSYQKQEVRGEKKGVDIRD